MAKFNENTTKKFIIIILVILIIAVIWYLYTRIADKNLKDFEEASEYSKYYAAETIRPRNLSELYGYSGQNELNDLYMATKSFVTYMARLKNDVKDITDAEELKKFFSDNETEIKAYTSIADADYFVTFVNYIKDKNVEEEFKYAEVISGSAYLRFNYYWVEMNFYYGVAEEPVYFNVGLATKSNNKTKVKFTIESNNIDHDSEEVKKYKNELKQNDKPGGNAEY